MIIGSHNSFSYLPVKKWWMNLIKFTARCQDVDIFKQYNNYNVRCFDLHIRFSRENGFEVVHGKIVYDTSYSQILNWLALLNTKQEKIYVRILHDVRNEKTFKESDKELFKIVCSTFESNYSNIIFWCGRNLYNWEYDYHFKGEEPSCEEKYSSVRKPKLLDDWYPRLYAKLNNKAILKEGTDKDILLIDFVNYGQKNL